MKVFSSMKLSELARTASASSRWYSTRARGMESKLKYRPTPEPITARKRTGTVRRGRLRPAARMAVISWSAESRPRVSSTPVSSPMGSA